MDFNIAVLHQAIAAAVPEREAMVWRDRRITWAESGERVRCFANLLADHGLGIHGDPADAAPWDSVQDHLGIYMYNAPEYLEGVLGAHLARLAPFNLNYRYTGAELSQLLTDARPRPAVPRPPGAEGGRDSRRPRRRRRPDPGGRRCGPRAVARRRRLRDRHRRFVTQPTTDRTQCRRRAHRVHRRHNRAAEGRPLADR